MTDSNFNFFSLIKKAAVVLDLDEPVTFEDTEETEYKKLKNALNSVNRSIVLMEQDRWTFRDQSTTITLREGIFEYTRPDGLMTSIHLQDKQYPLIPEYAWNYLYTRIGTPDRYNVYGDKLMLYPIPSATSNGKILTVKYCTNMCAQNAAGTLQPNMELETDFSLIPTQFSDALIFGTCRDYKAMPDRSKYQHYNSRFTQELRQMRTQLKRSQELEPYHDIGDRKNGQNDDIVGSFFKPWV